MPPYLVYLSLVSILFAPTRAFWILGHGSLTQERLDPIVSPGQVSSHVHNIIGSSAFGPNISFEILRADKNCTTAPVQADMSNYWAPQLYYQNQNNKTFTLVPISYVNTYYLQRPSSNQTGVKAFPADFRMVAGSAVRTSYNSSNQADRAVNFVCLNYNSKSSNSDELPDVQCPDGLRAQIVFPSCWDGKNVDSNDHKSHVSYPLGTSPDNGDCPESHPVKLITLFHEWVFDTGKFEFVSGAKNFVFSTGDETGLTFHADFANGWDVNVLQAAADQCTGDLFNGVENCPPFVSSIDRNKASSCKIARVVEEEIDGPLTVLPGCNSVPFTGKMSACNVTEPAITSGGNGTGNTTTSSSAPSNSAPTMTPTSSSSPLPSMRMIKRHYSKRQHNIPLHRYPSDAF